MIENIKEEIIKKIEYMYSDEKAGKIISETMNTTIEEMQSSIRKIIEEVLQDIERGERAGSEVEKCSDCGEYIGYYDYFYGDKKKPLCLACLIRRRFKSILESSREV